MVYKYMAGFGNHFESESIKGALPVGQNTPKKAPHGLYTEQLSGTAFTVPRAGNARSWLYRIRPSVMHKPFVKYHEKQEEEDMKMHVTPVQLRWAPFEPKVDEKEKGKSGRVDFVDGMRKLCESGHPELREGLAIYIYNFNQGMSEGKRSFFSSDGDFLIVPQEGGLLIQTEFGNMEVRPLEIAVIQCGMKFTVNKIDGESNLEYFRGYILEVYSGHFSLPDLGPIGANGLANPRDFLVPVARYEKIDTGVEYQIINKMQGQYFKATQAHSPYDVVAWHGNYVPYKYDLTKFCVVNSVSYDHLDPSIFTVLTCKSTRPGTAVADFVIFPPRFAVQQNTFRPPYFHRNVMTEFMGLISGHYEAKKEGFMPGGASLHSMAIPHGPDTATVKRESCRVDEPERVAEGTMSFMFESMFQMKVADWALNKDGKVDENYHKAWEDMPVTFTESE